MTKCCLKFKCIYAYHNFSIHNLEYFIETDCEGQVVKGGGVIAIYGLCGRLRHNGMVRKALGICLYTRHNASGFGLGRSCGYIYIVMDRLLFI